MKLESVPFWYCASPSGSTALRPPADQQVRRGALVASRRRAASRWGSCWSRRCRPRPRSPDPPACAGAVVNEMAATTSNVTTQSGDLPLTILVPIPSLTPRPASCGPCCEPYPPAVRGKTASADSTPGQHDHSAHSPARDRSRAGRHAARVRPAAAGAPGAPGRGDPRRARPDRRSWLRGSARCAPSSRARSPAGSRVAVALEAAVGRLLRGDVPADLLPPHAVAHELGDRVVDARDGLDRARQRGRRARARRVDPARGRHARRPDRTPVGGVLPDQELGQLRGRRRDRHADGAGSVRSAQVVAADGRSGRGRGAA